MAQRRAPEDRKVAALRESRTLNPHPEAVTDEAFASPEFFDARDVVQVKYEMVRRVRVDGVSVTTAAAAFGYSRPSYYEAAAALNERGLDGLVPGKLGPRGGHKLTDEVCAFAEDSLAANPALRPRDLVAPIQERFGVRVHPRSIERALARYHAESTARSGHEGRDRSTCRRKTVTSCRNVSSSAMTADSLRARTVSHWNWHTMIR